MYGKTNIFYRDKVTAGTLLLNQTAIAHLNVFTYEVDYCLEKEVHVDQLRIVEYISSIWIGKNHTKCILSNADENVVVRLQFR